MGKKADKAEDNRLNPASTDSTEASSGQPKWNCAKCTFLNDPLLNACEMCTTPRGTRVRRVSMLDVGRPVRPPRRRRRKLRLPHCQPDAPYWEKQRSDFCALHSVNCVLAAVGTAETLPSKDDFNAIAMANGLIDTNDSEEVQYGNWSALVMQTALRGRNLAMDPLFKSEKTELFNGQSSALSRRGRFLAFIINCEMEGKH